MSIFWFDRLQISTSLRKLILYEFFQCDIDDINLINNKTYSNKILSNIFDRFTYEKHKAIMKMMSNKPIDYYIIFYDKNDNNKKIVVHHDSSRNIYVNEYNNFIDLQHWFLAMNNIDGDSKSKPLGNIRTDNNFATNIVKSYWGKHINTDDQGLEYTRKLLTTTDWAGRPLSQTTKGFDFDLFLYFEDTNSIINIEFALNDTGFMKNTKCTPMRYCWKYGNKVDNTQKYNNLWQATTLLNGTFGILNYSVSDDVYGLSFIPEMDLNLGFRQEKKLTISKDNFLNALGKTAVETTHNVNHFVKKALDVKTLNTDFFDMWPSNKKDY